MADEYEYRSFDLPPNASEHSGSMKRTIEGILQPLGDEAWEITYLGAERRGRQQRGGLLFYPMVDRNNPVHRWVDARRPPYGTPAPGSWEYGGFNVAGMPEPEWNHHMTSRGWIRIDGPWYYYSKHPVFDVWHVFKRPNIWRGTDGGDILGELAIHGLDPGLWIQRLPWDPSHSVKSRNEIVSEILQLKWELSLQVGIDVGTPKAVDQWCTTHTSGA